MADVKIGDKVVIVDASDLDNGVHKGDEGIINSMFEEPNGNRYVMFQPTNPPLRFLWIAQFRVAPAEVAINDRLDI